MSEDYTYQPVTDWQARCAELSAWRDACPYSVEKLRLLQAYRYPIGPDTYRAVFGAMAAWLEARPREVQP